jgi:hypothetical protein
MRFSIDRLSHNIQIKTYPLWRFLQLQIQISSNRLFSLNTILIFLAVAVFIFHITLDIENINPRNISWLLQGGDWSQHFLGWHFYRSTPWSFPLGNFTGLLYPINTSVGYTDSIPLLAIPLKIIAPWFDTFQYIGLWLYFCFSMQGIISFWIFKKLNLPYLSALIAAIILQFTPMLMARLGHPALCAHWLFLLAFGIYINKKYSLKYIALNGFLVAIGAAIHPYIAIMAWAIFIAYSLRAQKILTKICLIAIYTFILLLIWYIVGYIGDSTSIIEPGLGNFSAHWTTWFNPLIKIDTSASLILPNLELSDFRQYEGFAYLGLGTIIATVLSVILLLKNNTLHCNLINSNWPLVFIVTLFSVFSILQAPFFDSIKDTQGNLYRLFATFRANGRFVWPLTYLLIIGVLVLISKRFTPIIASLILITVLFLNIIDTVPLLYRSIPRPNILYSANDSLVPRLTNAIQDNHTHLIFYPIEHPYERYFQADDYVPLAYAAGIENIAINLGYLARFNRTVTEEFKNNINDEVISGIIRDNYFYLIPQDAKDLVKKSLLRANSDEKLYKLNQDFWYIP